MICNQRQISHLNILTLENMDFAFVSLAVCISPAWPGSDDLRIQSVRIEIAINTTLPIFLQIIINYSNPGCSIPSPGPPACWLGAGWAATSDPATNIRITHNCRMVHTFHNFALNFGGKKVSFSLKNILLHFFSLAWVTVHFPAELPVQDGPLPLGRAAAGK